MAQGSGFLGGLFGGGNNTNTEISQDGGLPLAQDGLNNGLNPNGLPIPGQQTQVKKDEEPNYFADIFGKEEDISDFQLDDSLMDALSGKKKKKDAQGNDIPDETVQDGNGDDPDVKLNDSMKEAFKGVGLRLEDIPKDMDWNNPEQTQKFMSNVMQKAVQHAIHIMSMPVGRLADSLRDEIQTHSANSASKAQKQMVLQQAFAPFEQAFAGDSGPERKNYAKRMFQLSLEQLKDIPKAQKAAAEMVKATFDIRVSLNNGGRTFGIVQQNGDGGNGNQNGFKEGKDALDSIFDF